MKRSAKASLVTTACKSSAYPTRVCEIMRPIVVSLREDADLETAGSLLLSCQLDAAAVLDAAGRPVGELALRDLVREVVESAEWHPTSMRVADIMRRHLELIPESASIAQAAAGLTSAGCGMAVVVSKHGKLIGTLHDADILKWLAAREGYRPAPTSLTQLAVAVR